MENKDIINAIYEVRERVVRIETKLDKYNKVRETAYKAKEEAEKNREEICELKETQKWVARTGVASILGLLLKILYDSFVGR